MTFREAKEISPPPPLDLLDWLEAKWDAAGKNGKKIPDHWREDMKKWRKMHASPDDAEFESGILKFVDIVLSAPVPTDKMLKGMEVNWKEMRDRGEKVSGEWVKLLAVWKIMNRVVELELEYAAKSVFGDKVLVNF